ncbi:hypothetical protein [Crateriforma conspicua]|uniref:hypothetical protein n=1 Tax=Crateriforma conspicua TaxID=2527996 RepID=UPI0011896527|nr:hypothetical protein [Crateriforma conspicua]QDV62027.1 hypothetical protein Mal65_11550 [Crateriforma conspicua]
MILRSYSDLARFVEAFAEGHINLLILVGQPGLAKSRTVRSLLPEETCWIEGNATAFGIYQELYRHRDEFVVIDDVDSLYSDKHGIRLLKCLCQTEPTKSVGWHSATRMLERAGIPREFKTSSRVIIICNDWKTLNRNVAALQDRGHVLEFSPTPQEVHALAATWFTDTEVLDWFAANLDRFEHLSLRLYLRAAELKAAGLDWKGLAPVEPEDKRRRLVAELKADATFDREEDRALRFQELGGGCRATYFNHAKKLQVATPCG